MSTRTVAATGPSASSIDDVPPLVDRTGSVSREAAPPTETATAVASTSSSNKRARVSLSPPPKPTPATPRTKKVRKGVVDELARELMALIDDKPRKETYNKGKQFIDDAIRKYPWVTRGQIYGRRETIKEKERRDKARTLTKLAAVAATTRISSSGDMTNSYATQARETSASSDRTSPATSSTETADASNDSEDDGIAENVRWLYELSAELCEKIESEPTAMTVAINVYDCLEEIDEDDEEKFTSKVADGEPVMCIIVLSGKEYGFNERMGYDPRNEAGDEFPEGRIATDEEVAEMTGPGRLFPGGPRCNFQGKEVEALVAISPSGSITSSILRQALERLDNLGVYSREKATPSPVFYWTHTTLGFKFHSLNMSTRRYPMGQSPDLVGEYLLACQMQHKRGKWEIVANRMAPTSLHLRRRRTRLCIGRGAMGWLKLSKTTTLSPL